MMKKRKISTVFSVALLTAAPLMAYCEGNEIAIILPDDYNAENVIVDHISLEDLLANRVSGLSTDTVIVNDHKAVINNKIDVPAYYRLKFSPESYTELYIQPGENLTVRVDSLSPLLYTASGTPLMEGITEYLALTLPIENEYNQLTSIGNPSREEIEVLYKRYDDVTNDFVARHINSPAVVYALLNSDGQDFLDLYDKIGPDARASILMPFAEAKRGAAMQKAEEEKFKKSLSTGAVDAPDFTFPDLNGKQVSLSDYRGQWVVIDFWGSWCGWCIKGFPKLKEAFKKADGKFQVIGVDCRDSEAAWRAAVAKYELPWVNVYNADQNSPVLRAYGVAGFPTKAIVNPEGKLVDVTVGEDPTFYDKLSSFINK